VKKKDFTEAIALLRENTELAPEDPSNFYKLGILYEYNKDYDTAVTAFKKALDLKSDHAKALNALGRVYMKTGRADEAKPVLEAAKKADPRMEETTVLLGNVRDEVAPEPVVYRKRSHRSSAKKRSERVKVSRKGKKFRRVSADGDGDEGVSKGKKGKKSAAASKGKKGKSSSKAEKSSKGGKGKKSSKGKKKK